MTSYIGKKVLTSVTRESKKTKTYWEKKSNKSKKKPEFSFTRPEDYYDDPRCYFDVPCDNGENKVTDPSFYSPPYLHKYHCC